MDHDFERKVRERAYHLWQKEGSPQGRDHEFWERANLMETAEAAPAMQTPLGSRSAQEKAVDETMAESFPASDPPSFTATAGTRTEETPPASKALQQKQSRIRAPRAGKRS